MSLASEDPKAPVRPTDWAILAALRFIFCSGVFCAHMTSYAPNLLTRFFSAFGSFPGVAGFLILSGFSIRASYSANKNGYFQRRCWRVLPVYFFAMVMALIPSFLFGKDTSTALDPVPVPSFVNWIGNFFMLGQIFNFPFSANFPLWTVQVEFIFYLMAPLFASMNNSIRWTIIAISAILYSIVPHVLNWQNLFSHGYGIGPVMLIWLWLLGWNIFDIRHKTKLMMVLTALVVLIFLNYQGDRSYGYHRIASPLLAMTSLTFSWNVKELGIHIRLFFNWLGDLSYNIYAFHIPILTMLYTWKKSDNPLVYILLTLSISALVLHLIDRPLRKRGKTPSYPPKN